jgi:hypothetical protein
MGVGGQRRPLAALSQEKPGTNFTGGCVVPRVGVDGWENLAPTGIRALDRPIRSESLYPLRYPGPF